MTLNDLQFGKKGKERGRVRVKSQSFCLRSIQVAFDGHDITSTSGAIHGYVPTRDISVVFAMNLDVPKSQI